MQEIFSLKDKIDSSTGIKNEQALEMAKNLEFKGKNIEIVSEIWKSTKWIIKMLTWIFLNDRQQIKLKNYTNYFVN